MKNISNIENEKLLDYLDGSLSPQEKASVEQLLLQSEQLQIRLEELQQVHAGLTNIRLEEPAKNFTQMVMHKLDHSPIQSGVSTKNSILLLAGVLITVGVCTLLLSAGVFDGAYNLELNDIVIQNKYIDINKSLPSIPFNEKLVINIIILLNLALAFLVLDRTVLKPWFEKRTKMNY